MLVSSDPKQPGSVAVALSSGPSVITSGGAQVHVAGGPKVPCLAVAWSPCGTLFAAGFETKQALVWEVKRAADGSIESFAHVRTRVCHKRITGAVFGGLDLVLCDKAGETFLFVLLSTRVSVTRNRHIDLLRFKHADESHDGTLLCGHVSIVLAVVCRDHLCNLHRNTIIFTPGHHA